MPLRFIKHAYMQTCHRINLEIKYQRGVLSILRTRPENLSEYKKDKLQNFLKLNPAIQALYLFKERLFKLLKYKLRKARHCKLLIPIFLDMVKQLKAATFEPLVKLEKRFISGEKKS